MKIKFTLTAYIEVDPANYPQEMAFRDKILEYEKERFSDDPSEYVGYFKEEDMDLRAEEVQE